MSNVLKENIALRKQPSWVVVNQKPHPNVLTEKKCSSDQTEYEEYSFTGNLDEIIEQEAIELDKAYLNVANKSLVPGTEDTFYVGKEVVCTRTRLNGDIWELKVRVQKIIWVDEEEISGNQAAANEAQFGSEKEPRIMSVSSTAIQQSILFRSDFKALSAKQLAIIKKYMNGATDATRVPYASTLSGGTTGGTTGGANQTGPGGKVALSNRLLIDDATDAGLAGGINNPYVATALKTPVYYVPNINIQLSYWKGTKPSSGVDDGVGAPSAGGGNSSALPEASKAKVGELCEPPKGFELDSKSGYVCLFMGRSYSKSASGKGYLIQENYNIGQYDPSAWTPVISGGGSTGGTTSN
jgi:hypothetical protein